MEINRDCLILTLQGVLCRDRCYVAAYVSALRHIHTHVFDAAAFGLPYVSYVSQRRQSPAALQFDGAARFDLLPDLLDSLRG